MHLLESDLLTVSEKKNAGCLTRSNRIWFKAEMADMRTRMRDKEAFVEKKNQQLQAIQLEKHQRDSDIGELKDQMDIKERKISVLNRKIENLEDQLRDKEMQVK